MINIHESAGIASYSLPSLWLQIGYVVLPHAESVNPFLRCTVEDVAGV